MKQLLEFFLRYFAFLYDDPRNRITDCRYHAPNAALTVTGPILVWRIALDRGQLQLSVGPSQLPNQGFWMSAIRQYLDGADDMRSMSAPEAIEWASGNVEELEELFSDRATVQNTCDRLEQLLRSNSEKYWGAVQHDIDAGRSDQQ